jgi:RHS repeat-associated protein/fibro-slime domain-containing protein
MLALWKPRAKNGRKDHRFRGLNLQPLEERTLLAVDSQFEDGLWTIESDAGDDLVVSSQDGLAKINASDSPVGQIAASDVRVLRIVGGPESQVIDVSAVDRGGFSSMQLILFDAGPWLDPAAVLTVVGATLGPGWAEKLAIDDPHAYLIKGEWKMPLADGTLAKQITDAGWGNAQGLLDRIVDEAGRSAVVRGFKFDAGTQRPDVDVLFNGEFSNSVAATSPVSVESPDDPLTTLGSGDEDAEVYILSDPTLEPSHPTDPNDPPNTTPMVFSVYQSGGNGITFLWETLNNSATAPSDFDAVTGGTLVSVPQGASIDLTVTILSDGIDEPDEMFFVYLYNISGATETNISASGTIIDVDDPTTQISIADAMLAEPDADGATAEMVFTVTLTEQTGVPVTFSWETQSIPGEAVSPADYEQVSLTAVTIAPGMTEALISVVIKGDNIAEPDERFYVNLSMVTGAAPFDVQGEGTITSNEPPAFGQPPPLSVEENSPNKTAVGTVSATDPEGSTVTYEITSGNDLGIFAIDAETGDIEVADNSQLDFEAAPFHVLEVTATDAEGVSGSGNVTINVIDLNEAPLIGNETFCIDEDSSVGSFVGNVKDNPDDLDNIAMVHQVVTYEIIAGNLDGVFNINMTTGDITVADSSLLNYELRSTRVLTVRATDDADPQVRLSTDARITIQLHDLNEPPEIVNQDFHIDENSPNGAVVGHVQVAFLDAGETATFSSPDIHPAFALDPTGRITVANSVQLDYEAPAGPYVFTVRADDQTQTADAQVTITVDDVNEAPTIVDQPAMHINFNIDENSSQNALVGQVMATDPDAGDTKRFAITAGNVGIEGPGLFAIDPDNGELHLNSSLDFETQAAYEIVVDVTDKGLLRDSQVITITVDDVNEAPTLLPQSFTTHDSYNTGTYVGTILASDPDANDTLTFHVISGGSGDGLFSVDLATGDITQATNSVSANTYTLNVQVTDSGTLSSDIAEMTVVVEPSAQSTVTFQGIFRDFHNNAAHPPLHPDFSLAGDITAHEGFVGPIGSPLGPDGKPVPAASDPSVQSPESFSEWFSDVPGVNSPVTVPLVFERSNNAVNLAYKGNKAEQFFPLDNLGFGTEDETSNGNFTLELHAGFTYREGRQQGFHLTKTKNDLWIFVNGRLFLDMGRENGGQGAETTLLFDDEAAILGLEDGKTYSLDIFFAKRTTGNQSKFVVEADNVPDLAPETELQLTEATRFESTIDDATPSGGPILFSVPEDPKAIAFSYRAISFDTDDTASINDAFELALLDQQGNSLVPTIDVGRDSFFNFTEGEQPLLAPGAILVGATTVVVDISNLTPGIEAELVTRLVNNDGVPGGVNDGTDTETSVFLQEQVHFLDTLPTELTDAVVATHAGAVAEANGQVVLEAERYTSSAGGSGDAANSRWQAFADAAAGNRAFVEAAPNLGIEVTTPTDGPRLDYAVDFATTGIYYVWVLLNGGSNSDDSVHVGLDGVPVTSGANGIADSSGAWHWENMAAGAPVTINVQQPGLHTFNLWMHKDGVKVDQILLTTNSFFTPSAVEPQSAPVRPLAPRSADFGVLSNVTTGFDVTYGRTSLNATEAVLFADVTLTNNGTYEIRGDTAGLLVGVRNISHPSVELATPDGITPDGIAYYDVSRRAFSQDDTRLKDGDVVAGIKLDFVNPFGVQFDYDVVVFGALNRPPEFVTEPVTEVHINNPAGYVYDSRAEDPDAELAANELVTYEVVAGPDGLSIPDPTNGRVTWSHDDIVTAGVGTYMVTLLARDPDRATSQPHRFQINVVNVPNRPPRFTSIPVVDAFVGTLYEYPSTATDDDGDTLTFESVVDPGGDFFINPVTGVVTWTPPANLIGTTVPVTVRVEDRPDADPQQLFALQTYNIFVHPDPLNHDPIIISEPSLFYNLPGTTSPPFGLVGSLDNDMDGDPTRINIASLDPGQVFTETVTIQVPTGAPNAAQAADIVFVVDESGSMSTEHAWLATVATTLDAELKSRGIGDDPQFINQFGLVGFGGFPGPNGHFLAHAHPIDEIDDPNFGSAAYFEAATSTLIQAGGTEDGWAGVEYALSNYTFRDGASVNIILVTDEDRDNTDSSLTFQSVLSSLNAKNAILNVVVDATYQDGGGTDAVGVDSAGNVFLPDNGDVIVGSNPQLVRAFGTTVDEYVELAWETLGATWDLNALRQSGLLAASFTKAFVTVKANEIASRLGIEVILDPDSPIFTNFTGIEPGAQEDGLAEFDIQFVGNGQPHAFDLKFVEAGTGNVIGSIPVTINSAGYEYDVDAIDPDDDVLLYELVGETYGASINGTSGEINWDPPGEGSYTFEAKVTDGRGGEDTQKWTVIVGSQSTGNHNPIVTSVPPTSGQDGRPYRYNVVASDEDGDALTYFLVGSPAGMTIDRKTGVIDWLSPVDDMYEITVRVADGRGGVGEQVFDLMIQSQPPGNQAPRILSTAPTAAVVDFTYRYDVRAEDPDADPLTFELVLAPDGMTIDDETGVIVWKPDFDQVGVHSVLVRVTDGEDIDLQRFDITTTTLNEPPEFTSTPFGPAGVAEEWEYELTASDPNGDVVEFVLEEGPAVPNVMNPMTVTQDPNGRWFARWQPEAADVGKDFRVSILADDGRGGSARQLFILPVGNIPPAFDTLPSDEQLTFVFLGEGPYNITFTVRDPDGDANLVTAVLDPTSESRGMEITKTVGLPEFTVQWTPSLPGDYPVSITIKDDPGAQRTLHYTLRVAERITNKPPNITSIPSGPAFVGQQYVYELAADDPDNDPVVFSLDEGPTGAAVGLANDEYVLTWTPAAADAGTSHRIAVLADDGNGGRTIQSFDLPVVQPPLTNDPPGFSSQPTGPAYVGELWQYVIEAFDPEGDELFYSLDQASLDRGMAITDNVVSWMPDVPGDFAVTVLVEDGHNPSVGQIFTLPVQDTPPVNTLPVITSTPRGPAVVGQEYVYQVTAADPEGQAVEFRLDSDTSALGASIDSESGKLTWTPVATGDYLIAVIADDNSDPNDGFATQQFTLPVVALPLSNDPPVIRSLPPSPAQVDRLYEYQVDAFDPNGDAITFILDRGPEGMTLDQNGLLLFVPTRLESISARIIVQDEVGNQAIQELTVPVIAATDPNDPPEITSKPLGPAVVDREYRYQVIAEDPNGDPLTYLLDGDSISRGANIDADGLLTWMPTAGGTFRFSITVTDGSAAAMQTFDLPVIDNAPPTITSTPEQTYDLQSAADYTYDIVATDPNTEDLATLQFVLDPASVALGMELLPGANPAERQLVWESAEAVTAGVGIYRIEITVTDDDGAGVVQRYDLQVYAQSNSPPFILEPTRTTVQAGQNFIQQILAEDPDGDPIEYFLVAPFPAGMTMDDGGLIQWQTSTADIATSPHSYNVQVKDGRSGDVSAPVQFEINVVLAAPANSPPEFTSVPTGGVVLGSRWTYQATATDPDGDAPLTWALDAAPAGMAIDPQSGLVTWTPTDQQLGDHDVTIRVTDPLGASGFQSFMLVGRGTGVPPQITSTPDTIVLEAAEYTYKVAATDVDTNLVDLTFDLITPADDGVNPVMAIETVTGEPGSRLLRWTPGTGASTNSPYLVEVKVSDPEGGSVTQTFDLTVTTNIADANLAPVITSDPIRRVADGEDYVYTVAVTDPDGSGPFTYDLEVVSSTDPDNLAGKLEFDPPPDDNVLRWTAVDLGVSGAQHQIRIIVTDEDGGKAYQTYTIEVAAGNTAPQITSIPPGAIPPGQLYEYDVIVTDPDLGNGDYLTFALENVTPTPTNAPTIDINGRVRWQSAAADTFPLNFSVVVTDSFSETATEPVSIAALIDNDPPVVAVQVSQDTVPVGSQVTFFVDAIDNVDGRDVAQLILYVDDDNDGTFDAIPIGPLRQHTMTLDNVGPVNYYAEAIDTSGNLGSSAQRTVSVFDSGLLSPKVVINSPTDNQFVSERVDVVGTIDILEPTATAITYTVSLISQDPGTNFARIDLGTFDGERGVAAPEPLGAVIDPLLLPNGAYFLEITAFDGVSAPTTVGRFINVQTETKIGNFSLTFTDVDIPVAGFPITVTRTYDTYNATRNSELGFGWELDIANTDLEVLGNTIDGFVDGTQVNITLPDGTVESFVFAPVQISIFSADYLPAFQPVDSATTSTLSVPQRVLRRLGSAYLDFETNRTYDPGSRYFNDDYTLTTREGIEYLIDSRTGDLLSMTDRHGNTVYYTGNGIYDQNGLGITFERTISHLTAVIDPLGRRVEYDYDAAGDLVKVTNRAGETTQYVYDETLTRRPHFLTSIIDARGITIAQASFDESTGQLTELVDAAGNPANFGYTRDLGDGRTVETAAADDTLTELVRDERGNVIRQVQLVENTGDAATNRYQITVFRYDDPNDSTLQTAASQPFEHIGDADRFDVLPDSLVWGTRTVHDLDGNVRSTEDALGNKTFYDGYNQFGQPQFVTGALGNVTENQYNPFTGVLDATIDAEGNRTDYDYNGLGSVRQISGVNPAGQDIVTNFDYDSSGRLVQSTNVAGHNTYFTYDDVGNRVLTYFHWEDPADLDSIVDKTVVTRTFYDLEGRVTDTAQYTLDGEQFYSTASELDAVAVDWTTGGSYDSAGQVVRSVDRFGNATYNLYDVHGNVVETRSEAEDESGSLVWIVSRTFYDNLGRAVASTDRYVVTNANAPTDAGFSVDDDVLVTPMADLRVSHAIYDDIGRVIETQRLAGVEITISENTAYAVPFYDTDFTAPVGAALDAAILARAETIFDGQGRVATKIAYDTTAADPVNTPLNQIWFEYDVLGRQTATIQVIDLNQNSTLEYTDGDGDGVPDGGPEMVRTETTYDAGGRTETTTDANGVVTRDEYDNLGRVVKTVADVGGLEITSETKYDALGRREAEIAPYDPANPPADFAEITKNYTYDASGRLKEVQLPEVFNPLGITGAISGTVKYQYDYDAYGNRTLVRDPMDNDLLIGTLNKETSFEYDEQNRQLKRTLPDGLEETFTYNSLGQQTRAVDFEGRVTDFVYDTFGRLETKKYATIVANADAGTYDRIVTYTYDAYGRVTSVDDDGHGITNTVYDADGRVIQIESPEGILNYSYDRLGRQTRTWSSVTTAATDAITDTQYTYDELGRLKTVEVHERNNVAVSPAEVTAYRYDKLGNLDQVENPGNVIADYDYDSLNRLTLLRHFADDGDDVYEPLIDTLLAEYDYTVRPDGKRSQVVETDDQGITTTIDWVYDELGRLAEERFDATGTTDDFIARYGYDLASNRVRVEKDNGNHDPLLFTATETTDYTYDENDRLLTESLDSDADTIIDKTTVYEYGSGNTRTEQTKKTVWQEDDTDPGTGIKLSETTYAYNVQGRLETVEVNSDGDSGIESRSTYRYNDSGIRINQKVETDTTGDGTLDQVTETDYVVDSNNHTGYAQVLEERNALNSVVGKTFTLGLDVIAQQTVAGGTLYLLYDGHGSTRRLVDATGQLLTTEIYRYDAFGVPIGNFDPATALTSLLYSGEQTDATGLQYLRARYYDLATGRFNRLDPFAGLAQDPLTLHKYSYVHGDPVMGIDPTGEFLGTAVAIGIGAIIGGLLGWYNGGDWNGSWSNIGYGAAFGALGGATFALTFGATGFAATTYLGLGEAGAFWTANLTAGFVSGSAMGALSSYMQGHSPKVILWNAEKGGGLGLVLSALFGVPVRYLTAAKIPPAPCFPPGTPVLMADGTSKNIEEIVVGDTVLAVDPVADGDPQPHRVAETCKNWTERLIHIEFDSDGDERGEGEVVATSNHLLWTQNRDWQPAEKISVGDRLQDNEGNAVSVVSVSEEKRTSDTHNLLIEDVHTYFVVVNGVPILVHNGTLQPGDAVPVGTRINRWWGGESLPWGKSWANIPIEAQSRTSLGIDYLNSGEFLTEGVLVDNTDVYVRASRRWGIFPGGEPEIIVPNAEAQVELESVTIGRFLPKC